MPAQLGANANQQTFYTRHDAAIGGMFLAGSAGLSLFDPQIAHFFQDTTWAHVRIGRKVDGLFSRVNETTLTVGGLALFLVGRATHERTLADVSFHVAESVAAASLTSQVIRGPLGRTRPRDADKPLDDQYDFHFMQGFRHFQQRAFPSIHSSSGFAAASAVVAEVHWRDPGATYWVAVPAYAIALTPGLARLYLGQHWASDIFAGAFMGTFYGWRIVQYSHVHGTTPLDRRFLGAHSNGSVSMPPLRIGWTLTF
ncbi:MAG TPA: phosphatase PAP2 family protein [Gemmatimonadaceae bacterium]